MHAAMQLIRREPFGNGSLYTINSSQALDSHKFQHEE